MVASAVWLIAAAPAIACLADGAVAVSLNLSKANCEAGPKHVSNAACCSGKASPVWNANTNKCDTTCDSSAPCAYVVCQPLSACHVAGVCNPATGICSNPTKPDNTACSDKRDPDRPVVTADAAGRCSRHASGRVEAASALSRVSTTGSGSTRRPRRK